MRRPETPGDYLNIISRAVFSAGVSWAQIDAKWDAFEDAFSQFDPVKVALFDDLAVERLVSDPRLIASHKKMAATVANAKALLAIEREYESIPTWLSAFSSYDEAARD